MFNIMLKNKTIFRSFSNGQIYHDLTPESQRKSKIFAKLLLEFSIKYFSIIKLLVILIMTKAFTRINMIKNV